MIGQGPAVLAAGVGRVGCFVMPPISKKLTGILVSGCASVRACVRSKLDSQISKKLFKLGA